MSYKNKIIINIYSEIIANQKIMEHLSSVDRKDFQPEILCPVKIFLKNEGEIKTFSHNKRW